MGERDLGGRKLRQFKDSDLHRAFFDGYCRHIHQPRVCEGWVSDCGGAYSATYVRHDRDQINLIEGEYMLQGIFRG